MHFNVNHSETNGQGLREKGWKLDNPNSRSQAVKVDIRARSFARDLRVVGASGSEPWRSPCFGPL